MLIQYDSFGITRYYFKFGTTVLENNTISFFKFGTTVLEATKKNFFTIYFTPERYPVKKYTYYFNTLKCDSARYIDIVISYCFNTIKY